jgi:hypothetical protein
MEVVDVVGVPLVNKNDKRKGFGLSVFYENKGNIACTIMAHRTFAVAVEGTKELPVEEVANYMKIAHQLRSPNLNTRYEVQPGAMPRHFFSYPDSDSEIAQMKELSSDVLAEKKRLYLFVVMKYRDDKLPKNQIRITEFCGLFIGNFDMWHNCGMNRIYATRDK